MAAIGVKVLEEGKLYAPLKFFSEEFAYKGSKFDVPPAPDVKGVVEKTMEEFPNFAGKKQAFVLYESSHSNGFATTNTHVRKTEAKDNYHYVCGGVNVERAIGGVDDKEILKFKELLDKAELPHKEVKPDEISFNVNFRKKRRTFLSCMEIGPDCRFALIRYDIRPEYIIFSNSAYAEGPKRDLASQEKVKSDALSIASVTQVMNDAFRDGFLRQEMPKDDPDELEDLCV